MNLEERKEYREKKRKVFERSIEIKKGMNESIIEEAACIIAVGSWMLENGFKLEEFKELYCTT